MPDLPLLVTCLYDLGEHDGVERARSVDDFLILAPAVLGLGAELVVFTSAELVDRLQRVVDGCVDAARVHIETRPLESWAMLAREQDAAADLRDGRRNLIVGTVDKDTSSYVLLGWARPDMLAASLALDDVVAHDTVGWIDLGLAHVAPPPADALPRLVAAIAGAPGRIVASALRMAPMSTFADRASWYGADAFGVVAGGLFVVPVDRLDDLQAWTATEVDACMATGWPSSGEGLFGPMLAEHPEAFALYPGEHTGIFAELGQTVPGEVVVADVEALFDAQSEPDAARRMEVARRMLGRSLLVGGCEQRARTLEIESAERTLLELVPGARMAQFDMPLDEGWVNSNPTITVGPAGGLRAVVRQVNYLLEHGQYLFPGGEEVVRTRNVVVSLDDALAVEWSAELDDSKAPLLRGHGAVRGFEDLRLFVHDGQWRALAVIAEARPDARPRIAMVTIDDNLAVSDGVLLAGPDPERVEKNWVPIVGARGEDGGPLVVYSSTPVEVREVDVASGATAVVVRHATPVLTRWWRGGSQLVAFDDGWLSVVHETLSWGSVSRFYLHRFVTYGPDFALRSASPPFSFIGDQVEFACGLVVLGDEAVVTFGVHDRTANLVTVPVVGIRNALIEVHGPSVVDPR